MKPTLIVIATGIALLLTQPVHAGGPVITEDEAPRGHSLKDAVPLLLMFVVAGIVLGGKVCNAPEPQPTPGEC